MLEVERGCEAESDAAVVSGSTALADEAGRHEGRLKGSDVLVVLRREERARLDVAEGERPRRPDEAGVDRKSVV